MKIKVDKLVEIVNDYLSAENEYEQFAKKLPYHWMPSNTPQDQSRYFELYRASSAYWDSMRTVCQMLEIDVDKLLALVKSGNRHEKKLRWQTCVHYDGDRVNERVLAFLARNDDWEMRCYRSTGRPMKCVED